MNLKNAHIDQISFLWQLGNLIIYNSNEKVHLYLLLIMEEEVYHHIL